jgi:hypothetical protein
LMLCVQFRKVIQERQACGSEEGLPAVPPA